MKKATKEITNDEEGNKGRKKCREECEKSSVMESTQGKKKGGTRAMRMSHAKRGGGQ